MDGQGLRLSARGEWPGKRRFVLQYSICFAVMAALAFSWFYLAGRTLVWVPDGYHQHYRAMVYYGQFLRQAVKALFTGGQIPQWSFALGEGNDQLASLHYYAMGDPFCLGAVLVPGKWMFLYYGFAAVLRLYVAGLAFAWLCRQTGQKNSLGILAGCFVYIFCYWAVRNVNRHPFFLNPMILLPLILGAVERVLQGKKSWPLILAVCFAGVCNFYFFYMLGLLTVLYALIRLVAVYGRDWKTALRKLGLLVLCAALGTAMAALVLAPVIWTFLHDVRTGAENARRLFYPLGYYTKLPHLFLNPEACYWLCIGVAAPALLSSLLLFRRRKGKGTVLLLFCICVLFTLLPIFGQALNGFAYIANRWSWAFSLVIAYGLTACWEDLMHLTKRDALYLLAGTLAYLGLCLLLYTPYRFKILALGAPALLLLLLLRPRKRQPRLPKALLRLGKPRAALLAVLLCALVVPFSRYAPGKASYSKESLKTSDLMEKMASDETDAIRAAAAAEGRDDFYRYSGRELTQNAGLNADLSSTQYYWSLSNPAVARFRTLMGVNEALTSSYKGYDDRTALLALTGVRYYAQPKDSEAFLPYGYTDTGLSSADHRIYSGAYALPLGYAYDSWIEASALEDLSFTQRQELLLHTMVLEKPAEALPRWSGSLDTVELQAELLTEDPEVTALDHSFVVTKAGASVRFRLDGPANSETLLEITGLHFTATADYDLYFGPEAVDPRDLYGEAEWNALSEKARKAMKTHKKYDLPVAETWLDFTTDTGVETALYYCTPEYNFYNGRHDFAQNLGSGGAPVGEVVLSFREPGVYTYDSLRFWAEPLEPVSDLIEARREAVLEQVRVEADRVSGTVTLDRPLALCLSIPWSEGWTAEVDGVPAELTRANLKSMALFLEPGTHTLVLRYERPLGRLGLYVSLAAWVLFAALVLLPSLLHKRRKRGKITEENK